MQLRSIIWPLRSVVARTFSATHSSKPNLKNIVEKRFKKERKKLEEFKKDHGHKQVSHITVNMIYSGMRGVVLLPCETSQVYPNEGVKWRGYTLDECMQCLPKAKNGGCQPLPEAIFWLIMTGKIPTEEQCASVSKTWERMRGLPPHVKNFLHAVPGTVHPMTQLSAAVTLLSTESKFAKFQSKMNSKNLWRCAYEDSMYLIANITEIAATIYARCYGGGKMGPAVCDTDWSANFASLLGFKDPLFADLLRLMLTIHCDHETGNVSSHAVQLVGSVNSDPFLAFAAGLNGLAGPLHGRAAHDTINFLRFICKKLGPNAPDEKIAEYIQSMVPRQKVPGFGNMLLRVADPRFSHLRNFCLHYYPDDPLVQLVEKLYRVVPPILKAGKMTHNPFPNIEAYSGVAWNCLGLTASDFYTVIFGVSRALGSLANYVWARAMLLPIERPNSTSMANLVKMMRTLDTRPKKKK